MRVQNLRTTISLPKAAFCYPTQCTSAADCGNTEQCGGCSFCQSNNGGATQQNCPSGKIDFSTNPPTCLSSDGSVSNNTSNTSGNSGNTSVPASNLGTDYDKTKRWPACAPGGKEPACCTSLASGGPDRCGWPDRGWCSMAQCEAGKGKSHSCSSCVDGNEGCESNQCKACKKRGSDGGCTEWGCTQANINCNCGIFTINGDYCNQTPFQTGKAFAGSVPGVDVSLAPTLTWALPYKPESGGYVNAYMWSCSSLTEDCMVFASVSYPPGDSVSVNRFYKPTGKGQNFEAGSWGGNGNPDYYVNSLKPNKTYWWKITPGGSGGVQYYADLWTFTTGTGASACNPGTTICGATCVDLQSNTSNCGACGVSCTSNQTCSEGKCVAASTVPTTHLGCVNGKCASVTGAGNNTDGCTEAGSSCGSSSCTTTDVCKTAAVVNNVCTVTNKADSTACATTTITGGTCQAGVCTTKANEANTCWGNLGANGRCYDCNGDGMINVLDFSCFRVAYGKSAQ